MRAHTQSAGERRSAARGKKCAELTGREGRSEAEKPDTEVGEREREKEDDCVFIPRDKGEDERKDVRREGSRNRRREA